MTDLSRPLRKALAWVAKHRDAIVDSKAPHWTSLCEAARKGLVHMVPIDTGAPSARLLQRPAARRQSARVTLTDAGRKSVQDAEAEAKRPKRLSY